jgi:hypothetical protein
MTLLAGHNTPSSNAVFIARTRYTDGSRLSPNGLPVIWGSVSSWRRERTPPVRARQNFALAWETTEAIRSPGLTPTRGGEDALTLPGRLTKNRCWCRPAQYCREVKAMSRHCARGARSQVSQGTSLPAPSAGTIRNTSGNDLPGNE